MSSPLVSDDLCEAIEPLLPKEPPKPKGGRPRIPDRAAIVGIIFVLRTGAPWRLLPRELGCGSGWTCWRRLRDCGYVEGENLALEPRVADVDKKGTYVELATELAGSRPGVLVAAGPPRPPAPAG